MARITNSTTKPAFDFSAIDKVLPLWGSFLVDSPAARKLSPWLTKVIGSKKISSATRDDLLCLLSAVYQAGTAVADEKLNEVRTPQYTTFYRTYNETENGRTGQLIGVFEKRDAADAAAKGKGEWGGPGRVIKGDGWIVGDYVIFAAEKIDRADLNVNLPDRIAAKKEAALAKLTPEERELLGLSK